MVRCVIFDLDDTLCDYRGAMENAKKQVSMLLTEQGIGDLEEFWARYHQSEPLLFRQFMEKRITRDDYRIRRYADLLEGRHDAPQELSAKLNEAYMREANHNIQLFADALPTLEVLRGAGIATAILTNGPSDGQRNKYAALRLAEHVPAYFISEEIGHSKPRPEAFAHVVAALGAQPDQVLMVGDALEHDVEGARKAGLRGVLLDRFGKHESYAGLKITSLAELPELIKSLS